MAEAVVFKGFKTIDGTVENFSTNSFENGYVYFVRTNKDKENGYIWFNGKKYGVMPTVISGGTY